MPHIDSINPKNIDNGMAPMDVILQVLVPKLNELIASANGAVPTPREQARTPTTVAFASDAALSLAIESGIDQSLIEPTGATGATKADVERALNAK